MANIKHQAFSIPRATSAIPAVSATVSLLAFVVGGKATPMVGIEMETLVPHATVTYAILPDNAEVLIQLLQQVVQTHKAKTQNRN